MIHRLQQERQQELDVDHEHLRDHGHEHVDHGHEHYYYEKTYLKSSFINGQIEGFLHLQ